jgi:hypothetical protein
MRSDCKREFQIFNPLIISIYRFVKYLNQYFASILLLLMQVLKPLVLNKKILKAETQLIQTKPTLYSYLSRCP